MINRLFPYPAISAAVFFLWLLLVQSLSPGHLLLALVLAFLGPRPLRKLDVPRGMLRRPLAAVSLILDVVTDIIRSNIAVARIILSPGTGKVTSGMMQIPLTARSTHASLQPEGPPQSSGAPWVLNRGAGDGQRPGSAPWTQVP